MRSAGFVMFVMGCVGASALLAGCGKANAPAAESTASQDEAIAASPALPAPTMAVPSSATRAKAAGKPMAAADMAEPANTESYVDHGVQNWVDTSKDHLSTFAVDVDTASYTIARRKLREGMLPPPAAVRTEEFVNYFHYDYPQPEDAPFAVALEGAPSPFEPGMTLLRVGIQGKDMVAKERKPVHLTFLVDTSGSMHSEDKLGLVKRSLRFLVDQLEQGDTVALSTYAGEVREVLAPTGMDRRGAIHEAIEGLSAGGSTAMASGLELAYRLATQNAKPGSVNRVIVCSDGDANVGPTSHGDMLTSIKKYADDGITLSAIGFGMGNYKDNHMEQLADKGNGNYYYIDTFSQAKRVFGEQLMGTLQVIAQDMKVQVDFDPSTVAKYRLIGYENRDIADNDFRNDKVDAGEIGAGHSVTALYEVKVTNPSARWATVHVRWKDPGGSRADERAFAMQPSLQRTAFESASVGFRRAVAVAALAENLRNSPFRSTWTIGKARAIAQGTLDRERPEELELLEMIDTTARLMDGHEPPPID